ncbi:hypothetical protein KJ693_12195 [bacterium]|nr:hypothetical protein [bacterium]
MKRLTLTIVVTVMMVGNLAFAQDTLVSIGLNSWYNSWKSSWGSETVETEKSAIMVGPTLKIKRNKIFGGFTYLGAMSDYEFCWDNYGDYGPYISTYVFKRSDLDLMGGYMITPRFGLYAGYKNSSGDITGTSTHPL